MRLALIDYLREWGRTEQLEHLQKSVTRDLLALEVTLTVTVTVTVTLTPTLSLTLTR